MAVLFVIAFAVFAVGWKVAEKKHPYLVDVIVNNEKGTVVTLGGKRYFLPHSKVTVYKAYENRVILYFHSKARPKHNGYLVDISFNETSSNFPYPKQLAFNRIGQQRASVSNEENLEVKERWSEVERIVDDINNNNSLINITKFLIFKNKRTDFLYIKDKNIKYYISSSEKNSTYSQILSLRASSKNNLKFNLSYNSRELNINHAIRSAFLVTEEFFDLIDNSSLEN